MLLIRILVVGRRYCPEFRIFRFDGVQGQLDGIILSYCAQAMDTSPEHTYPMFTFPYG